MSSDSVLPEKSMQIGETNFLVTDPLIVDVVFADYFTELRMSDGVVTISLAASVVDGQNRPELRIVSRLRMPFTTLANIQSAVTRMVEQAAKAKESAN